MHEVRTALPPLTQVFQGRHIVVTGVTGFLGKVWLSMVLHHFPGVGRITVLVRGSSKLGATERFEKLAQCSPAMRPLRKDHGDRLGHFLGARVTVLDADVTRPMAGLDAATVEGLGAVDAVLHFAGLTDFDPDPLRAAQVNIRGADHVADLAVALGAPMLHISTCYVAGRFDGLIEEQVVRDQSPDGSVLHPQAELETLEALCHDDHGKLRRGHERITLARERARALGWSNIYTYTKALGEAVLAQRDDLQLVVVRPAIVECAEQFPFPGWNEGINTAGPLAALLSTSFRRLPSRPTTHFSVVPVDMVARGTTLALAATLLGRADPVYNLGTCHTNPFTLGRATDLTGLAVKRYQRKHGATGWERLNAWIDNSNGDWGESTLGNPATMRKIAIHLREALEAVELDALPGPVAALVQEPLQDRIDETKRSLKRSQRKLLRAEKMLDTYRPFIWDTHWTFRTDHVRSLSDALCPSDAEHRYGDQDLCWRDYWVNVEYPGLAKWCFPLLDGGSVADDPAVGPPLRLVAPHATPLEQAG